MEDAISQKEASITGEFTSEHRDIPGRLPMTAGLPHRARLPLIAVGFVALLVSIYVGLLRMGWELPTPTAGLSREHAPLMVSGFLGTLIGLERAVALERRWPYAGPLLTGVGAIAVILGPQLSVGAWMITLGSTVLILSSAVLAIRRPGISTALMVVGAAMWAAGNGLWLAGWSLGLLMPWWAAFLVVTIAGERWELSRLMPRSIAIRAGFLLALPAFIMGVIMSIAAFDVGMRMGGGAMLLLAGWLLRHDIARRSVRSSGLSRFMGIGLLAGYVWLGVGGALWLIYGGNLAGLHYDAMVHAIFLGFVFSMIFAHAPVIFPAVLGVQMAFRPSFYVHLALLHASLILRTVSDLVGWLPGRQWGGMLNGAAIILFLAVTGSTVARSSPRIAV
jgi:hypothetical protein